MYSLSLSLIQHAELLIAVRRTQDVIDVVLGRMRGGVVVGGAAVVAVELL